MPPLDSEVQDQVRTRALESPDHVRVGQFVLRYSPGWSSPFANYAIPDAGAEPSGPDVAALIAAFRDRDRVPRLEYLPSCAPAVEPALLAAGFVAESRAPVLACTAESLAEPPAVAGLAIVSPASDQDYVAAATVQHVAFDGPGEASAAEVTWLKSTVASGGVVALARAGDGTVAGAGACTSAVAGVREFTGLAVAASMRHRGIGAALSAHLTIIALARGGRAVWLEPGDTAVERMYARIGYRRVGEKLNISLPRCASPPDALP